MRFSCLMGLAFFLTMVLPGLPGAAAESNQAPVVPLVQDFPMPRNADLCGEGIPLENRHAYEMLDRELTLVAWDRAQVFMWLKRSGRYFPHIEKRLRDEGMPDDIKYLAVAESSLLHYVGSYAGAKGTWQFMPETGVRFGLRKSAQFDDRYSFERSTEAALKYLKRLHGIFGSWTLAMAAYNCGEGRVMESIKDQNVREYYRLNLPLETERYIYRIAAIKLVLSNPKKYGYDLSPERVYQPYDVDRVQVDLKKDVHISDAARAIGTDFKVIKELNPEVFGSHLPRGSYYIFVPQGSGAKMTAFLDRANKETKSDSTARRTSSVKRYRVKAGDTLLSISRRTGVPVSTIKSLNNIRGSHIIAGQTLRLAP